MTAAESRAAYRVWHLIRKDGAVWGTTREFIVIAKTGQEARELACDHVVDEDRITWIDRRCSHLVELSKADPRYKEAVVVSKHFIPDSDPDKIEQLEKENATLRDQIDKLVRKWERQINPAGCQEDK